MISLRQAGAAIALLIAFGAGWRISSWRANAQRTAELESAARQTVRRADKTDRAAAAHEGQRAQLRAQAQVITREIEHVVERPVYRDVCLDADGLRILSAAIDGAADAGQPAPALPTAEPAR